MKGITLQRIINRDPLSQGISASFVPVYAVWPPEKQCEMFEDCQGALCRALFNKNAADGFWFLFENTYQLIVDHPNETQCSSYLYDFKRCRTAYCVARILAPYH